MSDQQKDSSSDIMWLLFAIVAIAVIIYWLFGHELVRGYLTLKLWELKLITVVFPTDTNKELIQIIQDRPINKWALKEVFMVGGMVGKFANIPFIALVAFLAYKVWSKNPLAKFKRVLNMQTLKESEQRLWPYIAPMVNVDLIKESFDEGPYMMALRPYDFAVKHKLLKDEKNVASMDKIKAEKLFISQLGKLWGGFNSLRPHEQALFLIMIAHGCGDKKGAMHAVNTIAQSAAAVGNIKKMPDFASVKPLLKYLEDPRVIEFMSKHAYVYTVLAQGMQFARTTGVFPPSYIVWLRTRDRALWYVLNCVGRAVAFVEVAGIFGHWKAEQVAKHKIEAPFVQKAVDGLELALGEVKIVK